MEGSLLVREKDCCLWRGPLWGPVDGAPGLLHTSRGGAADGLSK